MDHADGMHTSKPNKELYAALSALLKNKENNITTKFTTSTPSSTVNVQQSFSKLELKVYQTLQYMRRTRILEENVNKNYQQVFNAVMTDEKVLNTVNVIHKNHTAFMYTLDISRKIMAKDLDPSRATYDTVLLTAINCLLTSKCPCQTKMFYMSQWYILEDVTLEMTRLNGIYKRYIFKRYKDYASRIYIKNQSGLKTDHNTAASSLRMLFLGIGYYLGKLREVLTKCEEINTGCYTCSRTDFKDFKVEDITIEGKTADMIRFINCVKDDILTSKLCTTCQSKLQQ